MSDTSPSPDEAPAVTALLETLCHPVRREVIRYFERTAEWKSAGLDDLVTRLEQRIPSETDEQLRIKLSHTHLPKLEHRGWLDYDPEADRVQYLGHDRAKQLLSDVHAIF